RRMERQPDRPGSGHQHRDGRAGATAPCRGRLRGRPDAQVQSQFRPAADFRRRNGSQADRFGLRAGPGGPRQMDPASFGGEGRRTADRRERQRQHDRSDAKKNLLKPHLRQQWVIAPEASAAFVANMEDVLEVYQRPHDPKRPLVCLDETSKQLIVETRTPITPMRSRTYPIRIFPTRTRSFSFRTISARIRPRRSTKPFPPSKRVASSNGSNGITRPSTEVGSTWPNPNSPSSRTSAWIAASPTRTN